MEKKNCRKKNMWIRVSKKNKRIDKNLAKIMRIHFNSTMVNYLKPISPKNKRKSLKMGKKILYKQLSPVKETIPILYAWVLCPCIAWRDGLGGGTPATPNTSSPIPLVRDWPPSAVTVSDGATFPSGSDPSGPSRDG